MPAMKMRMLTGEALGKAVREAIRRKGVTQGAVGAHFFGDPKRGQPNVAQWCKTGRIAKEHIPELVAYFADVVGPEHWGLPASWGNRPSALSRRFGYYALDLAAMFDDLGLEGADEQVAYGIVTDAIEKIRLERSTRPHDRSAAAPGPEPAATPTRAPGSRR